MTQDRSRELAARMLHHATQIMPTGQEHWAAAMSAELAALPTGSARRAFAFGCLFAAITALCKTRHVLAEIGRFAIGGALILLTTYGLYWIAQIEPGPAKPIAAALCLGYGGFAVAAFCSLIWFQRLALAGLFMAGGVFLISLSGTALIPNIPASWLTLLSLETCMAMSCLLFAGTFLRLLSEPEGGADALA